MSAALVVLAKEPVPGRVKTRLCPPFAPEEAARLAAAALADTLVAVARTACDRRVLVLDGEVGSWLPAGFDVVPQRPGDLGERLAGAFADTGDAAVVIGMDTPQVTPRMLTHALRALAEPDVDAVLGPAADGGYWAIGLRQPDARAFDDVPMSTALTCGRQLRRLRHLGLRVRELASMRDVDDAADAAAVATLAPATRFGEEFRRLRPRLRSTS